MTWTERDRTHESIGALRPVDAGAPPPNPLAAPVTVPLALAVEATTVASFSRDSVSPYHHVRPGAMAGSLILAPLCLCVLGLMLCGSVADSRAVFFRDLHEPAVPEEYGVDDGPQTFTMQDHFNYLRQRELERRRRGGSSQLSTLETTSRVEEEDEDQPSTIFVSDYCHTGANEKYGP